MQAPHTDHRKIELIMELRRLGISNRDVLSAIERVPRSLFVTEHFSASAWENRALPIECGQTISQPYVVAFMTEQLQVTRRHKVLEVGTGSGYQTAVLARLCRRVYTIERYRSLVEQAERRFNHLRLTNIVTRYGDGMKGWPEQVPFDRILVTAAAERLPETLLGQLKPGGVMVTPVGADPDHQRIVRAVRTEDGWETENLLPVRFVPLVPGTA
ncbi:MAG: protein-L-isoaspartate(D-aspartate) O-methyltransferase [Alphaproteobacteria bacterium]